MLLQALEEPLQGPEVTSLWYDHEDDTPASDTHHLVPARLVRIAHRLKQIDESDDSNTIAALSRMKLPQMTGQIRDVEQRALELQREEGREEFRVKALQHNLVHQSIAPSIATVRQEVAAPSAYAGVGQQPPPTSGGACGFSAPPHTLTSLNCQLSGMSHTCVSGQAYPFVGHAAAAPSPLGQHPYQAAALEAASSVAAPGLHRASLEPAGGEEDGGMSSNVKVAKDSCNEAVPSSEGPSSLSVAAATACAASTHTSVPESADATSGRRNDGNVDHDGVGGGGDGGGDRGGRSATTAGPLPPPPRRLIYEPHGGQAFVATSATGYVGLSHTATAAAAAAAAQSYATHSLSDCLSHGASTSIGAMLAAGPPIAPTSRSTAPASRGAVAAAGTSDAGAGDHGSDVGSGVQPQDGDRDAARALGKRKERSSFSVRIVPASEMTAVRQSGRSAPATTFVTNPGQLGRCRSFCLRLEEFQSSVFHLP